jgi:hypothetical protein
MKMSHTCNMRSFIKKGVSSNIYIETAILEVKRRAFPENWTPF